MEVLVASARVVLEGAAPLTFKELAARLRLTHHPLSVLHYKGYLARGGRRGPGVTLTGRAWVAIARAYGPRQDPSVSRASTSAEAALVEAAHGALSYLLSGGRPRAKDHSLLRDLSRSIGEEPAT